MVSGGRVVTPDTYRETLAALGISQAQLSRILDVDKGTPSRWATGAVPVPRWLVLLLRAWKRYPKLLSGD
jgi:hypothetical protein